MKQIFLAALALGISLQAYAAETNDDKLAAQVKANLTAIETAAAKEMNFKSISIDEESIKCLAMDSYDLGLVGTCIATGDLDYGNSSSIFSISVSDRVEGFEDRAYKVRRLTTEL